MAIDIDERTDTSTYAPGAPLRHIARPWPERKMIFRDDWREHTLSAYLQAVATIDGRTLYLAGGDRAATTPARPYWLEPTAAAEGWSMSNYTPGAGGNLHPSGATYKRDGHTIDVYMSARWFGAETNATQCRAAANILIAELRRRFDRGAHMMGTPARTGLDLLQRTLPHRTKDGREISYPPLAPALRDVLWANFGQGRIEYIPGQLDAPDGLYWLDGRWMYASCMRGLPVGVATLDEGIDYIEKAPAFYRITYRVPDTWPYPFGVLSELYDDDGETRRRWPATPGSWHHAWVTGAEYEVARDQGYRLHIHERMHWSGGLPDPTHEWIGRLRKLREETPHKLVYDAVRHLALDAVGAWWRQAQVRLHSTPPDQAHTIPADAWGHIVYPDRIEWHGEAPLHADLRPFVRPEWAATVWGRSLAKLASAAIRYTDQYGQAGGRVAWLRSDALVVTQRPDWLDDKRPGTFRVKRQAPGPLQVPATEEEYRELAQTIPEEH